MTLTIAPAKLARLLAWIIAGFLLAHLVAMGFKHGLEAPNVKGLVPLFDLNGEGNAPAWYAATTLFIAGLLLGVIAAAEWQRRAPYRFHWTGLALIFGFFSVDEAARIHELTIKPLNDTLGTRGFLTFSWVIPYAALLLIGGFLYRRFIRDLEPGARRSMILAGLVYVGGAMGVEMLSGGVAERWGGESVMFAAATTVEETLEMAGIAIFIHALVRYLGRDVGEVRFRIEAVPGPDRTAAEP